MFLNFSVVPFSKTSGPPATAGGSDTSLDKLKFVLQIVCAESELPEQLGVHLRRRAGQVDGSRHGVRHLGWYSSASVIGYYRSAFKICLRLAEPSAVGPAAVIATSRTRLINKTCAEEAVHI